MSEKELRMMAMTMQEVLDKVPQSKKEYAAGYISCLCDMAEEGEKNEKSC